MKILVVSLFLPREKSYHAGGRAVFEMIRYLSGKHEIHLATRLEENEVHALDELRPFCKEVFPYTYTTVGKRRLLDTIRLIFNYIGFSRLAERISRNGGFDIVQVEWVEAAIMMKRCGTPMILDAQDVITKPAERAMEKSRGMRRALLALKYFIVRALELKIVRRFDAVFTRSENDKAYLLSMAGRLNITVVPHPAGLDITEGNPAAEGNTMLFLASYKYRRVNVDAALYFYRKVFPIVRREIPDTKFIIAGYGPPEELTSLQEKDKGVIVPGFVDDIDECYKRAAVFVAPILIGGGIIAKILDALAAGTPVVTTSFGNEGIRAVPGRDLLVADSPEDFAEAVLRVLREKELADALSANGREFVSKHFSPDAVMNKMEAAHSELLSLKK